MSVSLRSISDHDLLSRTHELVARERKLTLAVLLHLNEIERRGLHLKQGYASMFDYCTSGLGYSSSAAYRRIQAARCVRRFPGLHALLERNELNLSTISQASRILNESNHAEVISRIRGKSQREAEAVLAEYQPSAVLRDRARTVVVRVPFAQAGGVGKTEPSFSLLAPSPQVAIANPDACEKSVYCRNGSECEGTGGSEPVTPAPSDAQEHVQKRIMLQFSVTPEFMVKFERIRSLAWHRLPQNASFEQVFELALDLFIEKEDPKRRNERRKQKAEGKSAAAVQNGSQEQRPGPAMESRRYVPAQVRDEIFVRDHGQCTFVGTNGKQCASRSALQIDHIKPVARGGASTEDNLRLLCAYHNRSEAERLMGRWDKPAPQVSAIEPG